jgi:hypothetical protein
MERLASFTKATNASACRQPPHLPREEPPSLNIERTLKWAYLYRTARQRIYG